MYSERDAETRAGQDWKWQTQETGGATERVYTQKSRGGEEETKGKGDTHVLDAGGEGHHVAECARALPPR